MIFNTPIWWQARIIFGNLCRLSAKRQNLQRTLIILLKLHVSQSWMSQDMNLGIYNGVIKHKAETSLKHITPQN